LSDLLGSQQNQDDHPEAPEPVTSDSELSAGDEASPVPTEIPLPDFDREQEEHSPVETEAELLDTASDNDPLEIEINRSAEVDSQGVYKVSSAEPNWSEFTFSSPEDCSGRRAKLGLENGLGCGA